MTFTLPVRELWADTAVVRRASHASSAEESEDEVSLLAVMAAQTWLPSQLLAACCALSMPEALPARLASKMSRLTTLASGHD